MKKLSSFLAAVAMLLALATSPVSAQECTGDCLMTGGKAGDYFKYYGPPAQAALAKAWADVPIATSAGTPANMDYVLAHPGSFMLAQGNVYGMLIGEEKYKDKFQILRAEGIGNEFVFVVVTQAVYDRVRGTWGGVLNNAAHAKFVNASRGSGPGRTFEQLQQMEPRLAAAKNVTYLTSNNSMDDALQMLVDQQAQVVLMVQAANPDNERFQFIKTNGLRIIPVRTPAMLNVQIPGVGPAFVPCGNQNVGGKELLSGACTPILLVASASNTNTQLAKIKSYPASDFVPPEGSFARYWKQTMAWTGTLADTLATWTKDM